MEIWDKAGRENGVSKTKAMDDYWHDIKKKKIIPRHGVIDINELVVSNQPFIIMAG